jgi:hypothetical protein
VELPEYVTPIAQKVEERHVSPEMLGLRRLPVMVLKVHVEPL